MLIFIKLILAHLIGDFILQPIKWVVHKQSHKIASKYLYIHVILHFALYMLFLWDLSLWKIALIITIGHYFIDLLKLYTDSLFKKKVFRFL